jgi:hypothetical protein
LAEFPSATGALDASVVVPLDAAEVACRGVPCLGVDVEKWVDRALDALELGAPTGQLAQPIWAVPCTPDEARSAEQSCAAKPPTDELEQSVERVSQLPGSAALSLPELTTLWLPAMLPAPPMVRQLAYGAALARQRWTQQAVFARKTTVWDVWLGERSWEPGLAVPQASPTTLQRTDWPRLAEA